MDPLTHTVLGAAVAIAGTRQPISRRAAAMAGVAGGLLPDADIFIRSAADPLFAIEYHRHFTHSIAFLPIIAVLGALIAMGLLRLFQSPATWRSLLLPALLGGASHLFCDAWTSYGTRLWWPFDQTRVALHWISVIDPLLTVPLAACLALAVRYASRKAACTGLAWVALYLIFCVGQKQRAAHELDRWITRSDLKNVTRQQLRASFGNALVWRALVQSERQCHVLAINCPIGGSPFILPGSTQPIFSHPDEAIAALKVPADSTQAQDIRRFFHFSDNWIGRLPTEPMVLADLRYAHNPTEIKPLWGIQINPADPSQHILWRDLRGDLTPSFERLFRQMKGNTAPAAP
jgi:inner membrane protein